MLAAVQVSEFAAEAGRTLDHTVNALILDDSEFDRAKLRRLFRGIDMPVTVREAASLGAMETVLEENDFDVVLIDHNLSDRDGFDALQVLKSNSRHKRTACIMITGNDQSKVAVRALKQGCSDYITKQELSADRLRTSVISALREVAGPTANSIPEVSTLADTIMTNYANALQPEIAGILRQVRTLRSLIAIADDDASELIRALERRCTYLWQALGNPEQLGIKP